MLVVIYREMPDGSLRRVADVTVPDATTDPEQTAWRKVGRGVDLAQGTYQTMRAGRRGQVVETRQAAATDLGPVT